MARRETLVKYDRGFCVPHDFQEQESPQQWKIRNPSTSIKPDKKEAAWQDWTKPTSLDRHKICQGRKIDLSLNSPAPKLRDKTLRFRRSSDK